MFPKMQDHTIDRLLRAQSGGSGKELQLCQEFDADLANAYVERSLTSAETARYEQHLAACSPCRKTIVALTRMARTDGVTAPVDAAVRQAQDVPRARRWFGALTAPQWAMAATAVIALAIALPLALSHRSPQNEAAVSLNGSVASSRAADATANEPTQALAAGAPSPANNSDSSSASRDSNARARVAASPGEKPVSAAEDQKTMLAGSSAGDDSGAASAASRQAAPPSTDQVIAKADSQPQAGVPAPAVQPAAGEAPPLPKIDEKEAKQLPEDKDAAKATTIKPGQAGGEERAKAEATVQADSIAPPPPPPSRAAESDRPRRRDEVVASGPASAFQPPREAVRGPSRRVGNHLFWLRGDVWTDKDYNPHKDMPMVTVIHDSDVYRDLLAKDAKIKPFLTGFPADARVIFVFKGTAYKLIPQDGDR